MSLDKLREAATNPMFPRYSLSGKVCIGIAVSVYDGDTFDVVLCIPDEGDTIKRFTVRMLGYNSPEIKLSTKIPSLERNALVASAKEARDALWKYLGGEDKTLLRVECHEWDKYGRLLARVYKLQENIEDVEYCVNDRMLELPHSVPM